MTEGVKITDGWRSLKSIKPDPKNSNRHPEKQISDLFNAIMMFGLIDKPVIRPNGMLIGGEGRWLALQRVDPKHDLFDAKGRCPVRVVEGLTETQYRMLALALNKLPRNSATDDVILHEVLAGIVQDGEDPLNLGFTEKELAAILDVSGEELEVQEIATSAVEDEFWISVRGPIAQQAEMLKRLEEASKDLAGVTVDLGTIAQGE